MALAYKTVFVAVSALYALLLPGCNRDGIEPKSALTGSMGVDVFTVAVSGSTGATVGGEVDDSVITAKIKSGLVADRDVKGFDIHVETRKGEVMLSGFVDSQAQIDRAVTIARQIDGVRKVDNKMSVKR